MLDRAKFVLSKRKLKEQLASLSDYSDVISYSFKTNYEVGKILEQEADCMFSVHTIQSAEKLMDKKKIWFLAQAWNMGELDKIFELGIQCFVVDNQNDLGVLLNYIKNKQVKVNLLLRMRLKEHTLHTGKHFVFGFYSDSVNKLIPELRQNKNVGKLGIHFHRKTQNVSEWSLKQELEQSITEQTLNNIDYVNIGGGLPSVYVNHRPEIIKGIFSKIKELKDWLNQKNIKMIIEPGRYLAAPCIKLVTKIKNIYEDNIIINASVYNSAMDTFIAHIRLLIEEEVSKGEGQPYKIKGSTPDSMDIFRYRVFLKDPKVGDTITFLNAGAYNFSTDFCLLPKLETEILE